MTSHYFTDNQLVSQHELRTVEVDERGKKLRLWTAPKVFSYGKLDSGTKQLLRVLGPIKQMGNFLDLGCGWGPLATYMALEAPDSHIWAVDVNTRALDLAQRNAKRHNIDNIAFMDETQALRETEQQNIRFDLIWSNPPIRIGKTALRELLTRWLNLLNDSGEAHLVVARNLGADPLASWLVDNGFKVKRIASKKGFRILRVTKNL